MATRIRWSVFDVPLAQRASFSEAQTTWAVRSAGAEGALGRLGGFDDADRGVVAELWADAGSLQRFLREDYARISADCGDVGTYDDLTVTNLDRIGELGGGPLPLLRKGLLQIEVYAVQPEEEDAFLRAQAARPAEGLVARVLDEPQLVVMVAHRSPPPEGCPGLLERTLRVAVEPRWTAAPRLSQ